MVPEHRDLREQPLMVGTIGTVLQSHSAIYPLGGIESVEFSTRMEWWNGIVELPFSTEREGANTYSTGVSSNNCSPPSPHTHTLCSAMETLKQVFRYNLCPREASFLRKCLKCGHSTIPFHHSIPVEHSTDSIPPINDPIPSWDSLTFQVKGQT